MTIFTIPFFSFTNGVQVVNVTPHALTFQDGEHVLNVPASGIVIDALMVEREVEIKGAITFVETVAVANETGFEQIARIRAERGEHVVIVGSIIAAQAYKGDVKAMIPVVGFERVPPAEKRMRTDKFTVFR